jgi:small subunit ribosomal protein S7|uniref:Small ribosomal subunit protein uS7c n=2 Tax=Euglena gracilis TaxID=3039 RepID=RR7_EUGGR|nr:ribosomal protein S7 [Euglena gracilis]P02360.2 RecName: Full=Small ribosomal subunit protein uS7c; AltName: Full=30S ribosomal protein S7, chloroplastic [Euglena gracilis]AKL82355.1 ribosomal protein S7 [Euglena gracilis var. bacillaris]CAA25158.1 unnamed protein product [Euglena gracilis]CAA29598.1 ribosomal protein S7 [Euglena gracilis]CAA50088.1 30S ribosomal protein S7 [Euglena gracilis]CAA77905.1 ribosomal protein S7 [Euglena gracilis]
MSRRRRAKKRIISQDPIYNSTLASKVINKILLNGKKTLAQYIFYETMKNIQEIYKKDPLDILRKAIKNASPQMETRKRRIGGTIYQVPVEVKEDRGTSLALKFIIEKARERKGRGISTKLKNEIIDASNNTGEAVKKKEEIHKTAEANKAFSNMKF